MRSAPIPDDLVAAGFVDAGQPDHPALRLGSVVIVVSLGASAEEVDAAARSFLAHAAESRAAREAWQEKRAARKPSRKAGREKQPAPAIQQPALEQKGLWT